MSATAAPPLFEAVIVPHRSLSRRGLNRLILAIAALCCVNATVFIHIGAWPVGGFTGVELLLAAVLLRVNSFGARASEKLVLTPAALCITRTSPRGARVETVLPPGWLNVEFVERPGRVSALLLVSHGVREEIGKSLGEEPKRELGRSLDAALRGWRNPVFDNPQLRG
jgi:uncharacterized membrane protein